MTRRLGEQLAPPPPLPPIATVAERVAESSELWARDLGALFHHARERFGDVCWEADDGDTVYAHKAVIYARAPKAFKDRYFFSKPVARSPTSIGTASPHLLPSLFPPRNTPSPYAPSGRASSLSFDTTSDGTLRAGQPADGILHLAHDDPSAMLGAQLEWLYTGEGFGDVVEWISEDDSGLLGAGAHRNVSVRDSLGRRGDVHDRRDKLGQDLTYMWRSKLYCDVRIHLAPPGVDSASDDSDDSTDSLSSTAIFTSHRFLLVSRSPYFASVLLNASAFRPHATADIHLATPPFTPAALHFCLGWMYAGHLEFSNRSFDLGTAFQIHRAAVYLQLDALVAEIDSRIAHDFCHGLDHDSCHCRRCPGRAARVWRFASAPDVAAPELLARARAYLVRAWPQAWHKEVGTASDDERRALVADVVASVTPATVVAAFRGAELVRAAMDKGIRSRGRDAAVWVDPLEAMVEAVEDRARSVLITDFATVAESHPLWDLVSGKGFSDDLLDRVLKEVVDGVGNAAGCVEAPKIYQSLVSCILLRVDPDTLEPALPARSRSRQMVEAAREGVLSHVRRRWMQIRDSGGFGDLENWSIKEISDEIDVSVDDLVGATPARLPRTTSRIATLSQHARSPSETRPATATPPEPPGLRRLRLSSSASTSSSLTSRSTRSLAPAVQSAPPSGPTARSPTAARQGNVVSVGSRGRAAARAVTGARNGSSSPTPSRTMSGPLRPLMARTTATLHGGQENGSPGAGAGRARTASLASARTVASTRTTATTRTATTTKAAATKSSATTPAGRGVPTGARVLAALAKQQSRNPEAASDRAEPGSAGTRPRTSSVSTTASTRSKAPSIAPSLAPSTASRTTAKRPAGSGVLAETAASAARRAASAVGSPRISSRPSAPKAQSVAPPMARVASASGGGGSAPRSPGAPTTASRLRTVSSSSAGAAAASPKPSHEGGVPAVPPIPSSALAQSRPSVRSPSGSTDEPEATTPNMSVILEPEIRRSESFDAIHLAPPDVAPKAAPMQISLTAPTPTRRPPAPSAFAQGFPLGANAAPRRPSGSSIISPSPRFHPANAFFPTPRPKPPAVVSLPDPPPPPAGSTAFTGPGITLHHGIPCIVSLSSRRNARFRGNVRYLGHKAESAGAWVGLEVDRLDRLGIDTLPSGTEDGIHYFHLSTPREEGDDDDVKQARRRRVDAIADSLHGRSRGVVGLGLGAGLISPALDHGKRSMSPFPGDAANVAFDDPRALFVRPSEILLVLGAE